MAAVTVVVPVYNEEANLGQVLPLFAPIASICELLFVDDGSTDATAAHLEAAGHHVLRLGRHQGFGAAVKAGLRKAGGDVVVWMPGNGRVDPLTAVAAGQLLLRSDHEQSSYIKAKRHDRPLRDRALSLLAGLAVSAAGRERLLENGGTPTAVHRRHRDLLSDGPDDLVFELFALWQLQRHGLDRLRFSVHFGPRLSGQSRWNRGLRSQLALLGAQMAAVRRWRAHQSQ